MNIPARQMIIAVRFSTPGLVAAVNAKERRLFAFGPSTERALPKVLKVGRILTGGACSWTDYTLLWTVSVIIVVARSSYNRCRSRTILKVRKLSAAKSST
jgi:hypothetical protein